MKRSHVRAAALVLLIVGAIAVLARLYLRAPPTPSGQVQGAKTQAPPARVNREPCRLLGVTDGDTIVVKYKGRQERVRLLRINTPEWGQPGFQESKEFLQELLQDKTIALEFERPGEIERDRYGRLLCYVFADGKNINVELVRAGWSFFWTRYGEGRYGEAFRRAKAQARQTEAGLWGKQRRSLKTGLRR